MCARWLAAGPDGALSRWQLTPIVASTGSSHGWHFSSLCFSLLSLHICTRTHGFLFKLITFKLMQKTLIFIVTFNKH